MVPVVTIASDVIYVSSPYDDRDTSTEDTGRLIRFQADGDIYTVDEQEDDLVDVERINKVFLYNKSTNKIVRYLDYIDPHKRKNCRRGRTKH